ncbi:midnolin-A-like [Lampris incognitus]|uniref:midnolin-A-like n=1 Tax=Lampris incognitus TaxID=2546036 RepID=UPI0024B50152|nr:midnolin-A-like [Lampris incognitus]
MGLVLLELEAGPELASLELEAARQRSPVRPKSPVGAAMSPIRLSVTSTTGSQFDLSVPPEETVEELVTRLSRSLSLPRDRIVLLYKERQLKAGKLLDLGVADESKLKLVPAVEAGFECQTSKTETSMIQSLESLTEAQISDFLSGRLPLTLSLGNGAHVMYVQLQLAVQNVAGLQQQHKHPRTWSDNKVQAGLMNSIRLNHPGSVLTRSSTNTPAYPTPSPSQIFPAVPHSPASSQLSSQRPTTFHLSTATATSSDLSNATPTVCHPQSSTSSHSYPFHSVLTSPSLPSHPPPSNSPSLPASPCSCLSPTCSNPGHQSPAVASTFPEINSLALSPDVLCQEPGAVIESLVNHAPGHFSGTFSGTLAPLSGVNHPRRGIAIILQILNDLLSATCQHQAMTHTLPQRHVPTAGLPVSPDHSDKASPQPPSTQRRKVQDLSKATDLDSHSQQASTEENIALRCKMEELQCLMHQRRLHRRTRCSTQPKQTPHPYQRQRGRSWTSGRQRINKCP